MFHSASNGMPRTVWAFAECCGNGRHMQIHIFFSPTSTIAIFYQLITVICIDTYDDDECTVQSDAEYLGSI